MSQDSKKKLHQRNAHNQNYDFEQLTQTHKALSPFVQPNKYGNLSIDFSNDEAVLQLNKALLSHFYGITQWSIPKNYLCPPIPGRADYIHYLADLLQQSTQEQIPKGSLIRGLDVGIGANAIYSLLGHKMYGWDFLGSDISKEALENVHNIVQEDETLNDAIKVKHQENIHDIFDNVIEEKDKFTFTLCNPPFHKSQKEATQGSLRKIKNLNKTQEAQLKLNFGGQSNELWCKGGEVLFIKKMIRQSALYKHNVLWFTTLVSKKESLNPIYKILKQIQPVEIKTIEMQQGQKISRFVAWTFFDKQGQKDWFKELEA